MTAPMPDRKRRRLNHSDASGQSAGQIFDLPLGVRLEIRLPGGARVIFSPGKNDARLQRDAAGEEILPDNTILRFFSDWTNGLIRHVPVVPIKSLKLYGFFREWGACAGCGQHVALARFVSQIRKHTEAQIRLARTIDGSRARLASVIFPPGVNPPADQDQQLWLGECLRRFDFGVSQWREVGKLGS